MLRPEKLGISAEPKAAVDTLNNWVRDCGKTLPADNSPVSDSAADKLISQPARTAAGGELYDRQDIEHVRNCWLFKQARSGIVRQHDSDVARTVALFELACRIVALTGKGDLTAPLNLYDIAVIGKGEPEDRAWIFAELLRQTGIDAVILRPAPAKTGATPPRWLVGALVDKQIYLFDPTLGWPIPSPSDKGTTAAVESAATLAQVLADDKLLRKLDISAEKPYPLRSADLKSARAEIITSSRYSSPRIRRLESFLSGDRSVTIYVPVGDVGSRPGLLSRVANAVAGVWKKEDVAIWDYPDRQTAAIDHLDGNLAKYHSFLWLPFQGPVTADLDKEKMKLNISPGSRKQIKSRIAQLQGDYAGAVRNYLLVQLDELPPAIPLPPEMQAAVRRQQQKPQEGPIGLPDAGARICDELSSRGGCQVLDGRLPAGAEHARTRNGDARRVLASLYRGGQMDPADGPAPRPDVGENRKVRAGGPANQRDFARPSGGRPPVGDLSVIHHAVARGTGRGQLSGCEFAGRGRPQTAEAPTQATAKTRDNHTGQD